MKIQFMKDDALTYFKKNVESNLEHYLDKDNSWVFEKYLKYKGEDISPFGEFKLEIPNFEMDMSEEKSEKTDCNNVKILYTALRNVSDTQASDERFWIGLAHSSIMWEYMQYRCKFNDENMKVDKVLSNLFFNYGNKRSLIVHILARLWWAGRLTYNENAKNPFEALEYFNVDFPTKVLTLFSSNFTNNPTITRAILNSIISIEKDDIKVGRKEYFEIIRYVNFLGGVIILDYLTEDELKEKIIRHYYEVNKISNAKDNERTEEKQVDIVVEDSNFVDIGVSNENMIVELLETNKSLLSCFSNLKYCADNFQLKVPIIKEYNSNFSEERLYRYGTRKNVFEEKVYEINGYKFLLVSKNYITNNENLKIFVKENFKS
ncbi:MAG: DUF6339 family protein [Clostridia bacterium]